MEITRGFGAFHLLVVVLSSYLVYGQHGRELSDDASQFNATSNLKLSLDSTNVVENIRERDTNSTKRILTKSTSIMNHGGTGGGGGSGGDGGGGGSGADNVREGSGGGGGHGKNKPHKGNEKKEMVEGKEVAAAAVLVLLVLEEEGEAVEEMVKVMDGVEGELVEEVDEEGKEEAVVVVEEEEEEEEELVAVPVAMVIVGFGDVVVAVENRLEEDLLLLPTKTYMVVHADAGEETLYGCMRFGNTIIVI